MAQSHIFATHQEWAALQGLLESPKLSEVSLNGRNLSSAEVIAVSLHGIKANLAEDKAAKKRIADSVEFLNQKLTDGTIIYGVNTGFGGSADTRTQEFELLQHALVQHLNVGILIPTDKGRSPVFDHGQYELLRSHALPVPIVRAMMLIRCHSLMRGHSGVRTHVIENILKLLSLDMTPVVPLRGSISASGDLSTLSYVAGAIEGNPDVYIRVGNLPKGPKYLPSHVALDVAGLPRIRLQAKEGLGITNGTAGSSATACIAIHQANRIAVLIQLLTAMGTEALAGTANNYDPFISKVRPHDGQAEAAANIRKFIAGSKISPEKGPDRVGLAQDRYALRTAPQWIGPQLEDLMLATRQVEVELNSTTDNPLIDVEGGRVHQGGNFQAMSITSAMEKTMTALQSLGRLIFAQSSELINNSTNRGLPPNLSPDDPSVSFLCKGFDVNMAAYMSELAYLAHPVSTHVQVAEMANQSVNSMAMVAARYALEAVEVVSMMAATYIFILCQALDLRCMLSEFAKEVAKELSLVTERIISLPKEELNRISAEASSILLEKWTNLSHLDSLDRGKAAVQDSFGTLLLIFPTGSLDVSTLKAYQVQAAETLSRTYDRTRQEFFEQQTTTDSISPASRVVYDFVRKELSLPFVRGVVDHPTLALDRELHGPVHGANGVNGNGIDENRVNGNGVKENGVTENRVNGSGLNDNGVNGSEHNGVGRANDVHNEQRKSKILGTMASEIYLALRNGDLHSRIMKFCDDSKFWT